jgi:hypothetical protein
MATIFGPDIARLELGDIEHFLASAADEGLTWEAKGRAVHRDHIWRACSAFGNSNLGGYLILGAERAADSSWVLPGTDVGDELAAWVSNLLREVENRPPFEFAGPWRVAEGRYVGVVGFRPSATPPVITPQGRVYERLVGTSPPVTDRESLARLFARGETARREAGFKSKEAVKRAIASSRSGELRAKAGFAIGLAPTGGPDDRAAVLFAPAFGAVLKSIMNQLGRLRAVPRPPQAQMWQDRIESWHEGVDDGFMASAWWDGTAVVSYRTPGGGPAVDLVRAGDVLEPAWRGAADIARAMGGFGSTFVAIASARSRPWRPADRRIALGRTGRTERRNDRERPP